MLADATLLGCLVDVFGGPDPNLLETHTAAFVGVGRQPAFADKTHPAKFLIRQRWTNKIEHR